MNAPPDMLSQLVGMGFPRDKVAALVEQTDDREAATEILLADAAEPVREAAVEHPQARAGESDAAETLSPAPTVLEIFTCWACELTVLLMV